MVQVALEFLCPFLAGMIGGALAWFVIDSIAMRRRLRHWFSARKDSPGYLPMTQFEAEALVIVREALHELRNGARRREDKEGAD